MRGQNKFRIERRNCEKYLSQSMSVKAQHKQEAKQKRRKKLMLFQGFYQGGTQVDITTAPDGEGYQPLAPVYFCTTKYAKKTK